MALVWRSGASGPLSADGGLARHDTGASLSALLDLAGGNAAVSATTRSVFPVVRSFEQQKYKNSYSYKETPTYLHQSSLSNVKRVPSCHVLRSPVPATSQ